MKSRKHAEASGALRGSKLPWKCLVASELIQASAEARCMCLHQLPSYADGAVA